MIRPIRVAPLSQTRMISENPLVPNTMTQEQYLANQFRSGNYAQPAAMAASRPVSPVAGLQKTAQAGLEGAKNQQRTASKLSSKVGGLLGDQQDYGGLLGGMQGDAALQGLFATMQAIGRPVRRGEDRYLGAVQYGQQQMDAAQKRGMADLSTRMQLEKFGLEKAAAERELALKQKETALLGQLGSISVPSDMMDQVNYLPEANQKLFAQALRYDAIAQEYAASGLTDKAAEFSSLAKNSRDAAFSGQMDPQKRTETELSENQKFFRDEYKDRYASVNAYNEMVRQAEAGGGISDYALLIKYIKVLDPNSVVREGEVTMTDAFKGYQAQFNELLKRAKGEGFDVQFRNSLLDSARRNAQLAADEYTNSVARKSKQYSLSGLRSDRIITTPSLTLLGEGRSEEDQAADAQYVDSIITEFTSGSQ